MKKHILQENYERLFGTLNESKRKHGFDLTDFKSGGFQEVLTIAGIPKNGKRKKNKFGHPQWEWKGKGILIVTANNPITGEYADKGGRKNEKNYASYMGIEGEADKVIQVVDLIKKYGSSKGESKGSREFI